MTGKPLPVCPECGVTFIRRGGRQVFCTVEHKRNFHHVMAHRGQLLLPLALAWRAGSRRNTPLAKWSRQQKDGLLQRWVIEDRAAGRNTDLVAATKMDMKWSHVDADTR